MFSYIMAQLRHVVQEAAEAEWLYLKCCVQPVGGG